MTYEREHPAEHIDEPCASCGHPESKHGVEHEDDGLLRCLSRWCLCEKYEAQP